MNIKLAATALLLCAASLARAESVNLYVADDFHPVDDVTGMAITASRVLDGERIVLVRDGQITKLARYGSVIKEAQAQHINFYVCQSDLENFRDVAIPAGFQVVKTPKEDSKEKPRTTVEKRLTKICSE